MTTEKNKPYGPGSNASGEDNVTAGASQTTDARSNVEGSLANTLANQSFLESVKKAFENPNEEQAQSALEIGRKWLPALGSMQHPHELLRIPWGDGSESGNFSAFATFLGFLVHHQQQATRKLKLRDCSAEQAAMENTAREVMRARTSLQTAQAELVVAQAETTAATAALTVAENNLTSAQNLVMDVLPASIWAGLMGGEAILFVAELYEQAFEDARNRARTRHENALQQETLLTQLVRSREQALSNARSAHTSAIVAWIICLLGF